MSLDAFGRRLGVSKQTAHQLEKSEIEGSITVKRLQAAADALDCELVVLLVPRQSLEATVRHRALHVAREQVTMAGYSMAMEQQAVSDERILQMVEDTANELIERGGTRLWA